MLCVWYQPQQAGHYSPEAERVDYKRLARSSLFGVSRPDEEEEDKELDRLINLQKARSVLRDNKERQQEISAERIENLENVRIKQAYKKRAKEFEDAALRLSVNMTTKQTFNDALGEHQRAVEAPKKQEKIEDAHAKRMYNLELARIAKQKEKERQEEIAKQRLKNLKKARKAKNK